MKPSAAGSACMLLLLAVVCAASAAPGTPPPRVIVTYKQSSGRAAGAASWRAALALAGIQVVTHSTADGVVVLEGSPETVFQAARQLPGVVDVEDDIPIHLHMCKASSIPCKFHDSPPAGGGAEILPFGIRMVQADDPTAGSTALLSSGVIVCVIDTGMDPTHPDLVANNITGCRGGECNGAHYDEDSAMHGTHVTGTVAAAGGNGLGVVGVVPGGAQVHGINIFPLYSDISYASASLGAYLQCEQHLDAVKAENAQARMVVQMSFGSAEYLSAERRIIDRLYARGDMLFVASAGNDFEERPGGFIYPASHDSVISVAAVNCNGTVAPFSQQNTQVELAAPGVGVLSTITATAATKVNFTSPGGSHLGIDSAAMLPIVEAQLTRRLSDCGMGTTTCKGAEGKICLIRRGVTTFACKHSIASASRCLGVLIYNNEEPDCQALEGATNVAEDCFNAKYLPSAALSKKDGKRLLAMVQRGRTTVTLAVNKGAQAKWYGNLDGTSMAAPHVSGVAARLWGMFPNCTNADVRQALAQGALDLGAPGRDETFGYGLLQAKAAAQVLASMSCAAAPL